MSQSLAKPRSYAIIVGMFSVIALVLAAAGIYALLSQFLAQHRHEFAVRVALGADSRDILRIFLGQGLGLTLLGIVAGVFISIPCARVIGALLYGVRPMDAPTFIAAVVTVAAIAIAAVLSNAWRAASIDPAASLRL